MPLAEIIKREETNNEKKGSATTEAAVDYLNRLVKEVENWGKNDVILVSNLLQEGQGYPLISGRFVQSIETPEGKKFQIDETTWLKALDILFEDLKIPLGFLVEGKREDVLEETKSIGVQNSPNLLFHRIREYDPDSGAITLLRLEISHRIA